METAHPIFRQPQISHRILTLLLLALCLQAHSTDFEQVDGPYDGNVTSFVKDSFSGNLYASGVGIGLGGGVFVSTDNGNSWNRVSGNSQLGDSTANNPPHYGIFHEDNNINNVTNYRHNVGNFKLGIDHTTNPNTLYTAYFYFGVTRKIMRSTDAGASWSAFQSGISAGFAPFDFAQAPNGDMYLAGFSDTGLYRLPSGGSTWQACTTTTNNGLAVAVDQNNGDVYFTNLQNSIDPFKPAVFRSTNQGVSFVGVTVPTSLVGGGAADAGGYNRLLYSIAIDNSITPPVVHVGFKDRFNWSTQASIATGGLMRSTDYGATWVSGTARNIESMTVDSAGRVFACVSDNGTYYGSLYSSNDRGLTFSKVNDPGINDAAWIISLAALGGGELMAGADGAYRSMDNGATWTHLAGKGLKASRRTTHLAIDSNGTLYAGSNQHGVSKSTDGGATWSIANGSGASRIGSLFVLTMGVDPVTHAVYAGTGLGQPYSRFYRSVDGGASWAEVTTFTAQSGTMGIAFAKNGNVIFGGMFGGPGGVFVSSDNGASCFSATGPVAGQPTYSLGMDPVNGDIYAGTETQQSWISSDNGLTFTQLTYTVAVTNGCTGQNGNKGNVYGVAVDATGNTVYEAALHGLFKSNNKGASWQEVAVPGLGGCGQSGLDVATDSAGGVYYFYNEGSPLLPNLKRSTDGGATWNWFNTGLAQDSRSFTGPRLSFNPNDGKMYAAMSGEVGAQRTGTYGLFRTILPVVAPLSTPTGSPTASQTPAATKTATASATATVSGTTTPSATRSATASSTPSATASSSPSATRTSSPSPSPTGTSSQSPTATPTASTSASPSATATSSPSVTPSFTASPLFSATNSPSVTASFSASPSGTQSASPSQTPSDSATPSLTVTATESPSTTPSVTVSASFSDSPTPTLSQTESPTPTISATQTGTDTPSPTMTDSPTATETATSGPSATITPTLSASPIPTANSAVGPPAILALNVAPNPNPIVLLLKLAGPADEVELRLYSPGFTMMAVFKTPPLPGGWSSVTVPAEFFSAAANGLCYLRAIGKKDGNSAAAAICKVFLAR